MTTCQAVILFVFMTDAFILQDKLDMAHDSLSMAIYELRELEKGEKDGSLDYTKALVFKSQGKIDLAEEKYEDATFHFAECVYFSAEVFGGHHMRVCAGYYHLGKSFVASQKVEQASHTLAFCADLWMIYLEERFLSSVPEDEGVGHKPTFTGRDDSAIPRFIELEAHYQLNGIEEVFIEKEDTVVFLKTTVCLGVLHFFLEDYAAAKAKADFVLQYVVDIREPRLEHLAKRLSRHSSRRQWQAEKLVHGIALNT